MSNTQNTTWQRYKRKFMQEPLIPIGVTATCIALAFATRKMQTGDRNSFNKWLRFRVMAQGLTIAAAVAGGWHINQERKTARLTGAAEAEREELARAKEEAVRAQFEARMREAEQSHNRDAITRKGVK